MFSRDSGELLVLVSMHSLTYRIVNKTEIMRKGCISSIVNYDIVQFITFNSEWRSLRIEDVRCSMLSKLSLRVAFSIFILEKGKENGVTKSGIQAS